MLENLIFRLFSFLHWLFAETSQIRSSHMKFLFLHIGLQNGMSNSTLKRNDDSMRGKTPKKFKPARVFAFSPGSGATVLAFVPLVVSIKFHWTTSLVRVFLCSRCPAARFFVFSFFRFFAALHLCPRYVFVMFCMCLPLFMLFLNQD